MPALAAMTFTGFSGYAVLLPVAPLWAVHGGADEAGAGLVNGLLLLFTVLTQLFVPPALRRFGWGPVLTAGMILLGVPAALYVVSDALAPVLALSAARGVGFGVLTVTGSAAVAQLVEPGRRGEAIGAYGLAVAVPNLVLLPAGPWVVDNLAFWPVFVVSALPLLGVPPALRLAKVIDCTPPDLLHLEEGAGEDGAMAAASTEPERTAYLRLIRPMLLLLSVTLAGGALVTFAPQMVPSALASLGLLLMGLVAAWSRWRVGGVADRRGAEPFIWPLVVLTGVGMVVIAWAVRDAEATAVGLFLLGMAVVGLCYGALQNLTLVAAFNAVSRPHYNLASAVWNVGFDAGTGLGSVAVGTIAVRSSFTPALVVVALVSVAAVPIALARPSPRR
jgi:predicted MFS family arabinose efflux permease